MNDPLFRRQVPKSAAVYCLMSTLSGHGPDHHHVRLSDLKRQAPQKARRCSCPFSSHFHRESMKLKDAQAAKIDALKTRAMTVKQRDGGVDI
jgi:hypothetical protein